MRAVYPSITTSFEPIIFPNQDHFGKEIAAEFMDRNIVSILALALTQSGKTGSMLGVIKHCLAEPSLAVPMDNIFVITGYSSTEWVEQTQSRFPEELRERVFHRNRLASFVKEVKHLKNVLILMDEIQIAFGDKQSIHNAFVDAGLMSKEQLYARDVKVVQFTATPRNTDNFRKYPYAKIVLMTPPPGYISIFQLLEANRIRLYKDVCGAMKEVNYADVNWKDPSTAKPVLPAVENNIKELAKEMGSVPRYHIVRTGRLQMHDVTILNFKKVYPRAIMLSEMDIDLDEVLMKPPRQHTFIFIKDKLRCAKTLHKEHLGILYDRMTQRTSMNSVVQGLAGRLTGYHNNQHSIVYTSPPMIRKYFNLWTAQFEGLAIKSIFIGKPVLPG
jgi:hypothetical protein